MRDRAQGLAEIDRLEAKAAAINDPEIRKVLLDKIDALRAELPPEDEPPPPAAPPPPTKEAGERADRLVAQARVLKMRGDKEGARRAMEEATAVAPGSAAVQEAAGDDFAERRRWKEATAAYAAAVALSPENVGIQRKHAEAVLRSAGIVSVEDQLRSGSADGLFLSREDSMAGGNAAAILSAILPGLGHVVLGRTLLGIGLMATWILLGVWVTIQRADVARLFGVGGGRGNALVLLPIFLMAVVYIVSLNTMGIKGSRGKSRASRPAPPVDLPFD